MVLKSNLTILDYPKGPQAPDPYVRLNYPMRKLYKKVELTTESGHNKDEAILRDITRK